jgi:hypothetical protein
LYIYEARVKKGAEQVATTKQPNVLSALSFQVSYPICIQLRQDSYVGVLLLFESPRENDGSNSGESRESRFTSCSAASSKVRLPISSVPKFIGHLISFAGFKPGASTAAS